MDCLDSNVNTRLLIIRHGNTFAKGEVTRRVGKTDLPLVESGKLQARQLANYLVSNHIVPDVAFSSTLQRTIQTASIIREVAKADFTITPLTLFDEVDYGLDENMLEEEVIARLGTKALALWDEQAVVPEGWNIDVAALMDGWQKFAGEIVKQWRGKTVLVVTSNGAARFAPVITGDYAGFREAHSLKLRTCALCIFEYKESSVWKCKEWGKVMN